MSVFSDYISALQTNLDRGKATEHTHRAALERLLESLRDDIQATNEPSQVECGAPDFDVSRGSNTIGYVEAKDIGESLDQAKKSEQLNRYLNAIENLLLTDYLEFRWYVDGDLRATARIATLSGGKLKVDKDGQKAAQELLEGFLARDPQPVSNPRELAERMARTTHMIRDIIVTAFEEGKASDLLSGWRAAFARVLIPDLDQPENTTQFADMFAQTLAYGLFSAAVMDETKNGFTRDKAQRLIPKTNPFLRDFFEQITGNALDREPFVGFVEDLVQLLGHADMPAILAEFGADTRQEDPIFHFYETFLANYDPALRERRGVYYTPTPVVSYIVRSVDHLLKTRFDLPNGLADTSTIKVEYEEDGETRKKRLPKVLILDPAAGTGTFLYEVIAHIREHYMTREDGGMWPGFVREHLLPRLYGFELLMAPYAVAHLKLGMQLAGQDLDEAQREKWHYDFASDDRLGIYLTNTLEEAEQQIEGLFGPMKSIAEEANAAGKVKRDLPIMVVLGNPPYSNFGMMNKGEWITTLITDWKPEGERKWNPDDFMKFMRWAQSRLETTGAGVLAFITNHTYIDGITHREMRLKLMETFDEIHILNLHGNKHKKEMPPDGSVDDNVFDIRQGVAVGIFAKYPETQSLPSIYHFDLWGSRAEKYGYLLENDIASTDWTKLSQVDRETCLGSFNFFAPKAFSNIDEYCQGYSIAEVFPTNQSGIKTDRDSLFFDFDKEMLKERIERFYTSAGMQASFRDEYNVHDSSSYPLLSRRENSSFEAQNITKCLYRPFDEKYMYYSPGITSRPAYDVMQHLQQPNLALIGMRQYEYDVEEYCYSFVSRELVECRVFISNRGIASIFPLYVYPSESTDGQQDLFNRSGWPPGKDDRTPNLSREFVYAFAQKIQLDFIPDGHGDLKKTFGPEDVFYYTYAIFHSPVYRERYAEFLKIDFPRLPLTSDKKLFAKLVKLGSELVALHLMESPALADKVTSFPQRGGNVVAPRHPRYLPPGEAEPGSGEALAAGRVYINPEQYFDGIPEDVWEFQIGGYQVLNKWLKDRKGRELSHDDLEHYQKIVVALQETMRLMEAIDAAIPSWPIE